MRDDRGDIWFGSWRHGQTRFDSRANRFARIRSFDSQRVHVLCIDSCGRLWVGTWFGGLYVIGNARNAEHATPVMAAPPEATNAVYSLAENRANGDIWVGCRDNLCIVTERPDGRMTVSEYSPVDPNNNIPDNELTSIMCDSHCNMWMGTLGGGVTMCPPQADNFETDGLERLNRSVHSCSVNAMCADASGRLWVAVGNYGVALRDSAAGWLHYAELPDFAPVRGQIPFVKGMMTHRRTGCIWMATYGRGVFVYDPAGPAARRVTNHVDTPWLPGVNTFMVADDSRGNVWIGTPHGLSLMTPDGTGRRVTADSVDMEALAFVTMAEDRAGNIWLGTNNGGIVRIDRPDGPHVRARIYSDAAGGLNASKIMSLCVDASGRLWAGTDGGGLDLYDPDADTFVCVQTRYELPGDVIHSIVPDADGNLWLATNAGLARLSIDPDGRARHSIYTETDGLGSITFNRNAALALPDGRIVLGGHAGLNIFDPRRTGTLCSRYPLVVTDLRIFGKPWLQLPPDERRAVSAQAPGQTREITLDYRHNNFSLEYAVLAYATGHHHKYAFRLDGFDTRWQTDADNHRVAYYNNLKPGRYTFRLRATDANDIWMDNELAIGVTVLPPPWRQWWAYLLYALALLTLTGVFVVVVRNRVKLCNALHLQEVERAKHNELNHAKLQFFTNVTHELMTPLTIISASVDELRTAAPHCTSLCQSMTDNVNRLLRLLQQILEFRKAESGNLQLRVSWGNVSTFVRRSVDSFGPLMKQKRLTFEQRMPEADICGWFDSDKLDKILYNLLSNASKYSRPGGTVSIRLAEPRPGLVRLSVADNGEGISAERQRTLFSRFYEGDYRRFNTTGTGIGLSLTKTLAELHRGHISVQSESGCGACFTVELPVSKDAFSPNEVEADQTPEPADQPAAPAPDAAPQRDPSEPRPRMLVVEDNEELLGLIGRLFADDYDISTATNGLLALRALEQTPVDIVITDVMMPEMDGIELCRRIKADVGLCHLPVLMLTAKSADEDKVQAYRCGADAYLVKPFSLSVLRARIANLIEARRQMHGLFRRQRVFESKELNLVGIDEDFMRRAIDHVHRHLADTDFDFLLFAQAMNVSKTTLFNKLKSLTGMNTSAFVRHIRLVSAMNHLRLHGASVRISELAYSVGFNDPRYFSTCFKKEFGMLPSEVTPEAKNSGPA